MTAHDWVTTTLATKLNADGTHIVLDSTQEISVNDFCAIFGASIEDATKPDKYVALSGVQTFVWDGETYSQTATELGYQVYFDQWHTAGLF